MVTNILRSKILLGLVLLVSVPVSAETIPDTSLPTYDKFRADMLRSGWIPDFNYGAKLDDGLPMYKYPEVICGNKFCSAQWIGKTDRNRVVIVLWMDARGGYRVAPQIEFPD